MGDRQEERMTRLAETAREVAREWGLELGRPFGPTNYSFVAPVGDHEVLKVVAPEDTESDDEAAALRLWDGDHAIRGFRHDPCARRCPSSAPSPATTCRR